MKRKYKCKSGGKIPEYGTGSTVGSVLGAIGGGTAGFFLGGPAGVIAGAGLGANLGGQIGGEFDDPEAVAAQPIIPQPVVPRMYAPKNTGSNRYMYPMGGVSQPNAEIEKQEVAKLPNGQTIIADAPTHDQGGLQLNLPPGTEISSDRLISPITGNTFAKDQAKLERMKDKANKRLTLRKGDRALKNSIAVLDIESDNIFKMQEQLKQLQMVQPTKEFAGGGTVWEDDPNAPYYSPNRPYNSATPSGYDWQENITDVNIPTNNTLSRTSVTSINNWATLGSMGLAGINMANQFADSLNPETITRNYNPNAGKTINTMQGAIRNQRGLRYEISDRLGEINRSEGATNAFIGKNLAGPNRIANRLSNRNNSMMAKNNLYGERNRFNTGIQTQANQMEMNLGNTYNNLGMQEAEFMREYQNMNLQQRAAMRRNRASALSDASQYLGQYGRDINQGKRDDELMKLLPLMFPHSNPNIYKR